MLRGEVWLIKLDPKATWQLPAAVPGLNRTLYFFKGVEISVQGETIGTQHSADLVSDKEIEIRNGEETAYLLLLQGRPINEPVAQHGPFVMNTPEEIQHAFMDYHQTHFGGWPWPNSEPDHGTRGRFAKHIDGREEEPDSL